MKSLFLNYSSYFEKDFVSLCFFDTREEGVSITACLCTRGEGGELYYSLNESRYRAEFYYSQEKKVGDSVR